MKSKIISVPEMIFNTIAGSSQSRLVTDAYNTDSNALATAITNELLPKLKYIRPNDIISIIIKILDDLVESINNGLAKK